MSDTIPVTDVDQLAQYISHWHSNRIKRLEHMMEIPVGTKVIVKLDDSDDEPVELELTEDIRKGFLIGLTVSLSEFGELPITATLSDASEEPEEASEDTPKESE